MLLIMEKLKIFARTVEDEARKQVMEMSCCDAYKDSVVRIMPDVHAGMGCTIGTVIALGDKVVPNTVGVDIGCGMLVCYLGKIDIDFRILDDVINNRVPSGFNIHDSAVMRYEPLLNLRCVNVIDYDMANRSIGSLGGGNHFIEIDEDDDGMKYLVIHSGSRNLGVRVCKYYQDMAVKRCSDNKADISAIVEQLKSEGRANEIQRVLQSVKKPSFNKDLAYLDGDAMRDYIHDMEIAQEYAFMNRLTIRDIIIRAMGWYVDDSFTTIHNYIETEKGILRKGSVRANQGERLIIPMNMRDGSLICVGKGNEDWLCSAPHGAGRLMSRKRAKETLSMEDFKATMDGVYSTSVCMETIDESPMAYKPMEEIQECIKDTCDVVKVIRPVYNFKAKGN